MMESRTTSSSNCNNRDQQQFNNNSSGSIKKHIVHKEDNINDNNDQEEEIVQGGYLFGVPINSFHPIPGPCPIIVADTTTKSEPPIKIHVQSTKLRIIIPVLDHNSTIGWLKEEFNKRALKRGQKIKLKTLYDDEKLLSDDLIVSEHLKSGSIVKELIGLNSDPHPTPVVVKKRKYKKGGHKKLALVYDLLNSYLDEMMSIEDDDLRQTFYERVCALPRITNVGLGKEEIVSWFKRAKKKKIDKQQQQDKMETTESGGHSHPQTTQHDMVDKDGMNSLSAASSSSSTTAAIRSILSRSSDEPALKKSCVELKSCLIDQQPTHKKRETFSPNNISPRFQPIRAKPTVAFAPRLVTEFIESNSSPKLDPIAPLPPLQLPPVEGRQEDHQHALSLALSFRQTGMMLMSQQLLHCHTGGLGRGGSSKSSSVRSSRSSSPMSWRDLLNKSLPCSPSVLSIGDFINSPTRSKPSSGEEDGGYDDDRDGDDDYDDEHSSEDETSSDVCHEHGENSTTSSTLQKSSHQHHPLYIADKPSPPKSPYGNHRRPNSSVKSFSI